MIAPLRCASVLRASLTLWLVHSTATLMAQDTPDYFRANCMNCHTIGGGRLAGPDLKDVATRKDPEWLLGFMQNPRAVVESGDAYARKLVDETPGGAIMPTPPGMTRYRAEQILKLIEAESKLEKSQFQGVRVSTKPFTEADRIVGRAIFTGARRLANGGASCNACHTQHDLPALGGGRLGPDLTRVYERLKGRPALSAWLTAPATETMQPIFKDHPLDAEEIHALVAYFEDSAKSAETDASTSRISFLLAGLGLATAVIFLFDSLWKNRFHAARRPLVETMTRAVHDRPVCGDAKTTGASSLRIAGTHADLGTHRGDQ